MWAPSKHQPIVHTTVYCSQSDWHLMFAVTQWAYDCRSPFTWVTPKVVTPCTLSMSHYFVRYFSSFSVVFANSEEPCQLSVTPCTARKGFTSAMTSAVDLN